ncbi:hypothetical protein KFK09_015479 [Dendrobium nobile]|uniref:SAM domain-containing protein n=1 Tax=Dendrobium nobile TaxID=94219 RepID=A0A8T3B4M2_DENNO|nr:hypothetical protein KFK09_015479 [Dendrobium nobile]
MDWYSWLLKSSRLDRNLIYEYSVLLSQNELEEDDIAHFDHEFLLSMGIDVAKHRLEILKLAKSHRRYHRPRPARPVSALLTVIHEACNCLTRYVNDLVHHPSKAVVIMPGPGGGGRQMVSGRSRKLAMVKKGRLQITDVVCNGVKAVQLGRSPASQSLSPVVGNGVKAVQLCRSPASQSLSPVVGNGVKAVQLCRSPASHSLSPVVGNGVKAVQLGRSPASQNMSPMALLASREEGHDDGFTWIGYNDTDQMRWDSMFQDLKPT